MSWTFLHPGRLWWLFAVAVLAAGYVAAAQLRARRAVKFTNLDLLNSVAPSRPGWRRWVVIGLTMLGFTTGVLGIAQPYRLEQRQDNRSIIMIVLDVSLSMQADDIDPNRFEAAKEQAKKFVAQIDPSIEAGLVSFSLNVRLRVPPTLSREKVIEGIDRLTLDEGTAIGDAIETTTDVITDEFGTSQDANAGSSSGGSSNDDPATTDPTSGSADESADGSPVPGLDGPPAAIVILTDGKTVEDALPGEEGAKAAAAAGIPVYGIAFGTPEGTITFEDPREGTVEEPVPVFYDELTAAAEITGGKFYAAESEGDLAEVYTDIEQRLEPALKQPEPDQVEVTVRYLAVALLLLGAAVALGQWWLGGIT